MLINYLKIAFRNLKRDKVYSSINIFGLAVGMTAFMLVALLLQFMYSFDTYHNNYKRIYRVQQEKQDANKTELTQTVYPLAHELKNTIPEIEEAAVIREIWSEFLTSKDDIVLKDVDGFLAEPEIFKILTFKFIKGNSGTALSNPGQVVLSKTLAQKLFPGQNPMNKLIRGSFSKNLIISGLIEDFPLNSHIKPSYLVSMSTLSGLLGSENKEYKNDWNNNDYRNYVLLKQNTNPDLVDKKIENILYTKVEKNDNKLYLKPLKDALVNSTKEAMSNSPIPYYAAIALFILLLACINFINLATARSGLREKEIGIRKVVGGSRLSLIKQFIGESVLVTLPATFVAFLLTKAYLPLFNSYMQTQLDISFTYNWHFIITMVVIFIFVGILAGVYPAFYLSSLQPLTVIKGNSINPRSGKKGKGTLRKILVSIQFVISITLILSTIFMFKQVAFMKNKDLGYNKSNLLRCFIEANESKSNFADLREKLLTNPKIIDASVSSKAPLHGSGGRDINWEGSNEDQKLHVLSNKADYNFINTFQMKITRGRNFSKDFPTDSTACLINETLASQLGWNNPLGKKLWDNKYTVIGVIKDFHQASVHNKILPYILTLHNGHLSSENNYCVRIVPDDISKSIQYVRSTIKIYFPKEIFELQFYDTDFDRGTMAVWEGVQNTFGFFSVLAIIIALIGLLGLVSFSIRRRTKEIGIRKVLGASEGGLYVLVTKEFMILIAIAIVLSAPSAYAILITAPGAYKYQVTATDFVIPLIIIIAVTIVVTLKQILSVTKANPTESLHYE